MKRVLSFLVALAALSICISTQAQNLIKVGVAGDGTTLYENQLTGAKFASKSAGDVRPFTLRPGIGEWPNGIRKVGIADQNVATADCTTEVCDQPRGDDRLVRKPSKTVNQRVEQLVKTQPTNQVPQVTDAQMKLLMEALAKVALQSQALEAKTQPKVTLAKNATTKPTTGDGSGTGTGTGNGGGGGRVLEATDKLTDIKKPQAPQNGANGKARHEYTIKRFEELEQSIIKREAVLEGEISRLNSLMISMSEAVTELLDQRSAALAR